MPLQLCERKDASAWSAADYPYIQRGFIRPYFRVVDAFCTYIAPNNETANVYSQLAGLVVFVVMFLQVKLSSTRDLIDSSELHVTDEDADKRKFYFEFVLAADILCCSCSLITHMYQSRSRRWHDVLAVCDWSGTLIITLVAIVAIDNLDMTEIVLHHAPTKWLQDLLLLTMGRAHLVFALTSLVGTLLVLSCCKTTHFFRFALVFSAIILLCLPGVVLAFCARPMMGLVGIVMFGIGGTLFGTHYPEKACPRTFDIACPSHTLWHIFYQLGLFCVDCCFASVFFGKVIFL